MFCLLTTWHDLAPSTQIDPIRAKYAVDTDNKSGQRIKIANQCTRHITVIGCEAIEENSAARRHVYLDDAIIGGQCRHSIIANLMPMIAPIQALAVNVVRTGITALVHAVNVDGQ